MNSGYFDVDPFDPVVEGSQEVRTAEEVMAAIPQVTASSVLVDDKNMERKKKQRKEKQLADPKWAGEGIKLRNRKALQTMLSEAPDVQAMIPELAGNKSLSMAQKISAQNQKALQMRKEVRAKKKEDRKFKKSEKTESKTPTVKKASLKPDSFLISKVIGQL